MNSKKSLPNSNPDFHFATDMIQNKPWPIAKHVFTIAEIGINHNGDVDLAKKLIDIAKECNCDSVKFQKRSIDIVYTEDFLNSPRESPWGITQRDQKEALEFDKNDYDEIDRYCKEIGIHWFASAWDIPSQTFLRQYNLKFNKVASPMVTHLDFLQIVAEEQRPTFISTGMSTYDDIDQAVAIFQQNECPFVLMHCVSEYPLSESLINLRSIIELRDRYSCPVGYSGHEPTMIPGALAAMMGAVAVERHISVDRSMYGSDQSASLEKKGLAHLVDYIRSIPIIIGDGEKRVTEGELQNAEKLRYWEPVNREK